MLYRPIFPISFLMYAHFFSLNGGRKKRSLFCRFFFGFSKSRTFITKLNAFFGKCEEHLLPALNYFYYFLLFSSGCWKGIHCIGGYRVVRDKIIMGGGELRTLGCRTRTLQTVKKKKYTQG
ncbi:hypothetical protein K450DRAFT_232606 [Umbelopsis ramanniana AG]|uniref:Uncharacterized protein n=1 Tax=Umbelopsis ramanniana AG TaxID=1314678 RepID=A0AAD5ECE2_UMBRA|nr:uncharacterized protein K450DRAFT_232606 [Umbelopsis ramanniana AG]KAI8581346.1 hypothetical protein K450DRAFT_232606 [Umbelopsis ramanniana AG]